LSVSMGAGAERRRLLDRVALYCDASASEALDSYTHSLRSRQRVLDERGAGARDLSEWEELLVRHGQAVMAYRERAASRLDDGAREAFSLMGPSNASLQARYVPGAPADTEAYRRELIQSRFVDAKRGSSRVGPHRDDLALSWDGTLVRGFASQGQHRSVVLALKAAEARVVATERGLRPVLLLDDVSSELDRDRTSALFSYLEAQEGQVFLTTTRPELISISGSSRAPRRDFAVRAGQITPL
jgi:DNA replication and repair protein RecF